MEESLHAAAHIIADYERGIIPDDPLIFSACYQVAAMIRSLLPSPNEMLSIEQFESTVTDILTELIAHDRTMASLIQVLTGSLSTSSPHVYHTPTALVFSPAQSIIHGNQYNLSGDFQGSIVNVASALEGVVQQVQAATLEVAVQTELIQLLRVLHKVLEDVPATHIQDAEAVASAVATVIGTALRTEPISVPAIAACAGAAAHLDGVLPEVSKLAGGIVTQAQMIKP